MFQFNVSHLHVVFVGPKTAPSTEQQLDIAKLSSSLRHAGVRSGSRLAIVWFHLMRRHAPESYVHSDAIIYDIA